MEEINLHFTGDFHAITSAHNLLARADRQPHLLGQRARASTPRRITWRRVLDMNDRALRQIVGSLGGVANGYPREDRLRHHRRVRDHGDPVPRHATSRTSQKRSATSSSAIRRDKTPVSCARRQGARRDDRAAARTRIQPNLVQTLKNNPAFIHGGPFANIAHGCNSVIATKTALKLADYVVTEAGFGADLGRREVLRHQVPQGRASSPTRSVIVATVRALKMHGGVAKEDLATENVEAVAQGRGQPAAPHRERAASSACRRSSRSTTSIPTPTPRSR